MQGGKLLRCSKARLRQCTALGFVNSDKYYCTTLIPHEQFLSILQQKKPSTQHQFEVKAQRRYYGTTQPKWKLGKKNIIDQLYDEEIRKSTSDHDNDVPEMMDFLRTMRISNAPDVRFQEKRKPSVGTDPPSNSSKMAIVTDYQYHDTESDTTPTSTLNATQKQLMERNAGREKNPNALSTTRVQKNAPRTSGMTYSKTTISKTSQDGTYTGVTTITSSNNSSRGGWDSDEDEENEFDKLFSDESMFDHSDDEDDKDADGITIDMPAPALAVNTNRSNLAPLDSGTMERPSQKTTIKSSSSSSSSSSWSISLDDTEFEIKHANRVREAQNQATAQDFKPIVKMNDVDDGDVCYEWDEGTKTMKPVLIVPSAEGTDFRNEKLTTSNTIDDVTETAKVKEYNHDPTRRDSSNDSLISKATVGTTEVEDDDENYRDMAYINEFYHATREQHASQKFENWWDRDDDLVNKAKRKMKLATLRKAQGNPLHKRSKTCPVCKRVFKGHSAMVDHAINKNNCAKDIDDSLKDQLKTQRVELRTKKKEKKKRKRNVDIDDLF
jgi:hypothetical protein